MNNDALPTMNAPHACPNCGATLPPDAPEGLCPACLLSGALPSNADAATMPMGDSPRASASQPMAPRAPEDLAPLFPQLEILELLGRGGMGAVYKARQKNLDRLVALKVLTIDPEAEGGFGERFQREAQALAKLNHPNIVGVFDFGVIDGLYYFLMEYVDGANLRSLIRGGELKPEAALALIPSFCDALQYAHDEGVVHRDIKPENVLVDKKGRVKIADFGLAKLLGQEGADHGLTLTGMALGTPRYMAPEQLDRPESVDHRADIYSLGVVFYEMLTGEIPMGRFALPSEKVRVDVKLDEIVLRSLERDVERRYQHASEVKTDVEKVTSKPVVAPVSPARTTESADVEVVERRSLLQQLAVEPVTGKAAMVISLAAMAAHKLQWQSLIVPGNQVLSPVNSLVTNCKVSVLMLALAFVAALFASVPGLAAQARKTVRGLAVVFTGAALWLQISFFATLGKWEPGQVGKTLRMTQSYPEFGLYATIALTGLALLLFLIRLIERETSIASLSQAAAETGSSETAREICGSADAASSSESPTKPPARHLLSAGLTLLSLFCFFFGFSFQAKSSGSAAGMTKIITVGALDPLYVSESGPSGFNTRFIFFSWSFFAVVVAGIAFGALWRVGREDQGKVARDPAWWRDWWKQVGIWGGLVLLACVVRTALNPGAVFKYTTPHSATVRFAEDPSRIPATRTAGRTDYAYTFSAPANHRLYVWIEWWKGGERTIDQDCNTAYVARRGDRLERSLQVIFNDGNIAGPATKGQVRIDWLFDDGSGNSSSGRWRPNFFEGLATSVDLDRVKSWKPKVGETVNLLEIRGGKDFIDGNPVTEERLRAGRWEAAMILRARVEAVPESRKWEGTITSFNAWNDNDEPSPALLRLGESFGAVLGPFTDARNLREQIASNIRKDSALRTKAEQKLTEAGIAFAGNERA